MNLLLIPVILIFVVYSCRFVSKTIMPFFKLPKKRNMIISVIVTIVLFMLCMYIGGIILAIAAHSLMLFLFADISLAFFKIPAFKKYNPSSLRHFNTIFSCVLLCGAIVMTIFGWLNATNIQTTRYTVSFDGKTYENTRIMFVSDIHARNSNCDYISKAIQNAYYKENPDIVIIGGDLTDHSTTKKNVMQMANLFKEFSQKTPVLFVDGNHDIMGGNEFDTEQLHHMLTTCNVTVLCDDVFETGGIRFVGRNESKTGNSNASRAGLDKIISENTQMPTVVIDHQPKELSTLGAHGVDMSLSGHTHNGQIFPIGYLCDLFNINEMQYGKKSFGSCTSIVSSGVGTWGMDVRTQGKSEIVIIDVITTQGN